MNEKRKDKSVPEKKFKRPPQFADQLLFPGRRLDRMQQSIISGYSGRSLDIETIVSGGRPETSSIVGAGGGPHPLLTSAGFTRSLNDVNDQPWDAIRQLPSANSHMSLLSRQSNGLAQSPGGSRGLVNTFPGASLSTSNLANTNIPNAGGPIPGGFPVSNAKWKYSSGYSQPPFGPVHYDAKVLRESSSPDSSYSSESVSELSDPSPKVARPPLPIVPKVQLHRQNSNASSTQNARSKYLKNPSKRKSDNAVVSPTPQLDKILWALVPDEFANISDTGISDMEPASTQHDSASSRYVTFTDLEAGEEGGHTSRVPNTPRRPILTEETLSKFETKVSSDDRIMQWLAECDEHCLSSSLPTHLPDISYTFKYAQGTL